MANRIDVRSQPVKYSKESQRLPLRWLEILGAAALIVAGLIWNQRYPEALMAFIASAYVLHMIVDL